MSEGEGLNEGPIVIPNAWLITVARSTPSVVLSFILIYGLFFSVPELSKTFTQEQMKQRDTAALEMQTYRDSADVRFDKLQESHRSEFMQTMLEQRRLTSVIEEHSKILLESVKVNNENNHLLKDLSKP